jgi:hypothetical protein
VLNSFVYVIPDIGACSGGDFSFKEILTVTPLKGLTPQPELIMYLNFYSALISKLRLSRFWRSLAKSDNDFSIIDLRC